MFFLESWRNEKARRDINPAGNIVPWRSWARYGWLGRVVRCEVGWLAVLCGFVMVWWGSQRLIKKTYKVLTDKDSYSGQSWLLIGRNGRKKGHSDKCKSHIIEQSYRTSVIEQQRCDLHQERLFQQEQRLQRVGDLRRTGRRGGSELGRYGWGHTVHNFNEGQLHKVDLFANRESYSRQTCPDTTVACRHIMKSHPNWMS